ncbi:hypothetical protein CSKR_202830, partial [Clonorchis sinensis]
YFEESQLSLALALMRFVSLVSSEDQDRIKPYAAQSLLSLTRKVGMPCWLADLRNDIAHGSLPSIELLERGFWWSLECVRDFWASNTSHFSLICVTTKNLFASACAVVDSFLASHLIDPKICCSSRLDELNNLFGDDRSGVPLIQYIATSILQCSDPKLSSAPASLCQSIESLLVYVRQKQHLQLLILQFILNVRASTGRESLCTSLSLAWVTALCDFPARNSNPLCKFLDVYCVKNFDWRRALSHMLTVCSIHNYDLCVGVVRSYNRR